MPAARAGRIRALALPPGEDFAAALDAAWQAGDAVLPLDPNAPAALTTEQVAAVRPEEPVPAGTAVCMLTSGSTGRPKGVLLSHHAVRASGDAARARLRLRPDDVWLSCLPWHHIGGLLVLLRARAWGTGLVIHDSFDVDRVAGEHDATLVSLVPTQLSRLLDAEVDLRQFRVILVGGAAPTPGLVDRARARGGNVVTTYGMTETCGGCVYDGQPLDAVDIRIGPDGRIAVRGPVLMTGYRDAAGNAGVASDGWFVTNDLGRWDNDRLVVSGRIDDVVVTGGANVPAQEVAGLLVSHPAVAEVFVGGVPDEEWGQRVVAFVVSSGTPPALSELRDWVRERAPVEYAPRQVVVLGELPLLGNGKVDRATLLRQATSERKAASQSADPPSVT